MTANLFNIQHFSLDDGPGIRTVVFFKGCPLDCAWCHNPESKKSTPELSFFEDKCILCGACEATCTNGVHLIKNGKHTLERQKCTACGKCAELCAPSALEIIGRRWTIDEVMEDISKDDLFFTDGGGVTFSGGEPFAQFDALLELLKRCKQKGYSTCIETSGYTDEKKLNAVAEFTDLFLYDFKESDPESHKKYVRGDLNRVAYNLSVLDSLDARVSLRCPIIPDVNFRDSHAKAIAELASAHPCIKEIQLMPYHPLGISKSRQLGEKPDFSDEKFLEKKELDDFYKIIRAHTSVPVK